MVFGDDTQMRRSYDRVITGERPEMLFSLAYERRKGVTRTQCLVVWDSRCCSVHICWVEWLGRVIDRHFHHSTVIGRNSDGKGRSCSNRRFVHFSAYAFQRTVGLRDRSDEIEESHYMKNEGRCPLACPTNLRMHHAARDARCAHLNTFVYSASRFESGLRRLNRETRAEKAGYWFDFHFRAVSRHQLVWRSIGRQPAPIGPVR